MNKQIVTDYMNRILRNIAIAGILASLNIIGVTHVPWAFVAGLFFGPLIIIAVLSARHS